MNKYLIVFACLLATVLATTDQQYQAAFTKWIQSNRKSYHHDEFQYRFRVFIKNYDFVQANNAKGLSYTVGLNKFADLTNLEFAQKYTGVQVNIPHEKSEGVVASSLPSEWNWNNMSAVTPIKDQGQCGSCWAFSTTGSTEGCHAITTKNLVSLSEKNLMDCSYNYGNEGCNGGLMTQAMQYIIANGGIDTEMTYPYVAEDGPCKWNAANKGATLTGFTNVASGNENDLQAKVYTGPTSVAIDASHSSFQLYQSGIYYEPQCSSDQLDHGVLAVGWGANSVGQYWIVKNSWGLGWGDQGYIWMSRNRNNNCGIATMATLPQC